MGVRTWSGKPVKMSRESGFGFALGVSASLPCLRRDGYYSSGAKRAEALNIQRNTQETWTHGRCLDELGGHLGRQHVDAQGAMPEAEFHYAPGGTRALKIKWKGGKAESRHAFLPPTTSIDSY
mmetsp:Transcript_39829/g.96101  ORF Transcript_39829/g.96101 Transcript_39829/m.96101 type:complete len:123 (-) Transcript_39829:31-399(-)